MYTLSDGAEQHELPFQERLVCPICGEDNPDWFTKNCIPVSEDVAKEIDGAG